MNLKDILCYLRSLKKVREFNKKSIHGKNLTVRNMSRCVSDNPGDIVIGDNCEIKAVLYSYEGGKITIGNNCFISFSTFIGAMDLVSIGNDVIISTNVRIFDNNNHPTSPEARRKMSHADFNGDLWKWKHSEHKPVVIKDNVWIGEYSAILKGVTIGKGSIVASHSVVTKDVPEYTIVAGNPAKVVKKLQEVNSK